MRLALDTDEYMQPYAGVTGVMPTIHVALSLPRPVSADLCGMSAQQNLYESDDIIFFVHGSRLDNIRSHSCPREGGVRYA